MKFCFISTQFCLKNCRYLKFPGKFDLRIRNNSVNIKRTNRNHNLFATLFEHGLYINNQQQQQNLIYLAKSVHVANRHIPIITRFQFKRDFYIIKIIFEKSKTKKDYLKSKSSYCDNHYLMTNKATKFNSALFLSCFPFGK